MKGYGEVQSSISTHTQHKDDSRKTQLVCIENQTKFAQTGMLSKLKHLQNITTSWMENLLDTFRNQPAAVRSYHSSFAEDILAFGCSL